MRRLLNAVCVLTLLLQPLAIDPRAALAQSRLPSAKEVVAPAAYVSLEPVPRGRSLELAVVLKIRPGFHINAREASADYLIPTDLRADLPAGFKAGEFVYPKGTLQTFVFSKTPLNVYEGTVTLRGPLTVLANGPLGAQRIPLKLRYQACSTEVCLPPVTLDLEASFEVAPVGSPAKLLHPEIFSRK